MEGAFIIKSKQMENAINEVRTKYFGKRERYDARCAELVELAKIAKTDAFGATAMSFDYGFMKGVRFAKSMMKKGERI